MSPGGSDGTKTDGQHEANVDGQPQSASLATGAAGDGTKGSLKKLAFKGYDEREKAQYNTTVLSLLGDEGRPLTALDEVLKALIFMCDMIEKDSKTNPGAGELGNRV